MRTLTCPDGSETLGINVRAFFDNLRQEDTLPIVQKYGLVDVDPEGWIPTRKLLDSLNELAHRSDFMSNLVAIGLQIGLITPVAPGVENPTIEDVLMGWNGIYQYLHRNADVGQIVCEKVSDKHFKLTFTDLYPDDFSYGILYGYGRRFLAGTPFTVYYDPEVKPRDWGGTQGYTVIHIKWE